jgi:hypothetical protein
MAVTLDEARKVVMELSDEDRQVLAEEIMQSRWEPEWRDAWFAEGERRLARMLSGEDRSLTLEEFLTDKDDPSPEDSNGRHP